MELRKPVDGNCCHCERSEAIQSLRKNDPDCVLPGQLTKIDANGRHTTLNANLLGGAQRVATWRGDGAAIAPPTKEFSNGLENTGDC
jgi:hypothetical protein